MIRVATVCGRRDRYDNGEGWSEDWVEATVVGDDGKDVLLRLASGEVVTESEREWVQAHNDS